MILIPVKSLKNAKQRLTSLLDQPARTELAQAMLFDVLQTVNALPGQPEVSLVSSDPFAVATAQDFAFNVIPDHGAAGETEAVDIATQICERGGAKFTLVIPGDIPLIAVDELQQILLVAPHQGSVLVPSADKRGTNAVLRTPPALFPLRFGNDSFVPHLAAAKATGTPCISLSLPGIALDIDNPSDLRQLASAPGNTRSQQLARQWNLDQIPLAANG